MEDKFDHILANKIGKVLRDHEEPYRDGAWEDFLMKRKKRKRRIVFWYLTGVASTVIILILLNLQVERDPSGLPIEGFPQVNEETNLSDPKFPESSIKKHSSGVTTLSVGQDGESKIVGNTTADRTFGVRSGHIDRILGNSLGIKMVRTVPISNFDLDSIHYTTTASETDALDSSEEDMANPIDKYGNDVILALQFASSLGTNGLNSINGRSQNYTAGISVDIPLKSKFMINTGVLFNMLKQSNDYASAPLMEGTFDTKTFTDIDQYNLDIPLNVVYKIPGKSNNLYVASGISSYVSLRQSVQTETETTREVTVFRETNGIVEVTQQTETTVISNNESRNSIDFIPLAAINLSVGYRSTLSDNIDFEIQPFYKFPLQSISKEDLKTSMAGIAFKVMLSN